MAPTSLALIALGRPAGLVRSPELEQRTDGRDAITSAKRTRTLETGATPPPIAVSGCLLGRRRTVWQRGLCPSAQHGRPVAPGPCRSAHSP